MDEKCKKQKEENKRLREKVTVLEDEIKMLKREMDKVSKDKTEMGKKKNPINKILLILIKEECIQSSQDRERQHHECYGVIRCCLWK